MQFVDRSRMQCKAYGAPAMDSKIVQLIPARALVRAFATHWQ